MQFWNSSFWLCFQQIDTPMV